MKNSKKRVNIFELMLIVYSTKITAGRLFNNFNSCDQIKIVKTKRIQTIQQKQTKKKTRRQTKWYFFISFFISLSIYASVCLSVCLSLSLSPSFEWKTFEPTKLKTKLNEEFKNNVFNGKRNSDVSKLFFDFNF
jgi:hypothetical protein